ncbi:SGNH/GDSL hydrolase family protein [Tellurirhabdus bombi]|uniref:SGNH/GDSL hydrolase family protein n=1 Tax=Tellurirhabdus bombi TaxID=2907205 RepID=UPI001F325217|nr:SGNH/GDSL hydrolase family protein [Tellurirhabdus bombi]
MTPLEEYYKVVDDLLPDNVTRSITPSDLRTILKQAGDRIYTKAAETHSGWTPRHAIVEDGDRLVLKVTDWYGGEVNKPAAPVYVGASGFVVKVEDAIDIRGGQGLPGDKGAPGFKGWTPWYTTEFDGERRVLKLSGYIGGEGTAPTADVGKYLGLSEYVVNKANAIDFRGPTGGMTPELQQLAQNTQAAAVTATQSKDLAVSAALNLTLSVEQMTASKTQTLANFSAFQFAGTETVEVRLIGTSILNNSNSAPKHFFASATKILGDSGNQTRHLGSTGGSLASLGWDYQVFGGHVFSRLVSKAGSQTLKFQHNMKRYVLRYSKEIGGGTFEVWADGVLKQTVSCAGAQAYGQEVTLTWPSAGMHTVEIKNMVGTVYIESHDVCLDRPGLYIVDGSYGGSAINNYLTLKGKEYNQIDGIAIQGWNGIDAAFGFNATIKPKVIFLHHLVNDAGRPASLFDDYYKPGIEYIVRRCNELGIQLIAVVEMGGHMSMPASGSYQNFLKHRQLLLDQRGKPNVTVLDWHAKSGLMTTDLVELDRLAKRYYSVTNLNVAAGTYAGDFIHPNNVGYAPELDMLHAATGLNFDGKQGEAFDVALLNNRPRTALSTSAKLYAESYVGLIGTQRTLKNAYGALNTYRNVGISTHVASGDNEAVWACAEEINYLPEVNNLIATGLTDGNGTYGTFTFNNFGFSISNAASNPVIFTITLIIGKGTASVRLNNNSNTVVLNQYSKGVLFTPAHALTTGFSIKNESDTTMVCHYTVEAIGGAFPLITLSASKIYGFYLTPTDHACIPGRQLDKLRDLIPSAYVAGEIPVEKINLLQRYVENINGKLIKSIAIGKEIYKPFQAGYYGLYRLQNTTEIDIREFTIVGNVVNNNYSEKYGSNLTTVDSNQAYAQASGNFDSTYAGKTYTLVGAIPGEATGISVQLFGNATYLGLRADGSWANDGGNHGTAPDVLANTRHYRGKTFAITFQMPPSELFAGANRVFRIYYKTGGGNHAWLDGWALCEGSKATVY